MISRILVTITVGSTLALLLLSASLGYYLSSHASYDRADLALFLDAYKVVGVALLVAAVGALAPHVLTETRDHFERIKESRRAYSRAKTAIIYLPTALATLTFDRAIAAIEAAHQKLHLAETYPVELRQHLKDWHPRPETWVDRNYWELVAMRMTVATKVTDWNQLKPPERLELLKRALGVVLRVFGKENEQWDIGDRDRKHYLEKNIERHLDDHFSSNQQEPVEDVE